MPNDYLPSANDEVFYAYHPDVVKRCIPTADLWVEHMAKEIRKFEDSLIVPICPCCGIGRTVFVHIQREANFVIEANFRDWCDGCKKKIATQLT